MNQINEKKGELSNLGKYKVYVTQHDTSLSYTIKVDTPVQITKNNMEIEKSLTRVMPRVEKHFFDTVSFIHRTTYRQ